MKKITEISYCRIFAMLFIIICHTVKYYDFIPFHSILGSFFNVGVEIFLIISGYLYGPKEIKDWKIFYKNRYSKILLPMQIWIIILIIFKLSAPKDFMIYFTNLYGLIHINKNINFKTKSIGLGHTWFVTIIFICYIIIPILQQCKTKFTKKKNKILLIITWIISLIIGFKNINIYYIPLFITGYYFSTYNILNLNNQKRKSIISILLCTIILISRLILLKYIDGTPFYNNIIIPLSMTLLAITFIYIVFILCNYKKTKKATRNISNSKIFTLIDKYSYYIFIVHYLFVSGQYNLFNQYNIIYATLLFIILTIISSYILNHLNTIINNLIFKKGEK